MQVNFLPKKTGQLRYKDLVNGATYKCVACDREFYVGAILYATRYEDLRGVWLNIDGVLGERTSFRETMLFEEFKCELVEIE